MICYGILPPVQFRQLQVRPNHYPHQLYSKILGAPFISTIHLSGITEVMAFTKGRKLIFIVSTGPEVDFVKTKIYSE